MLDIDFCKSRQLTFYVQDLIELLSPLDDNSLVADSVQSPADLLHCDADLF